MEIFKNCSLKKLNTFGIDVNAKQLCIIKSEEDVIDFIKSNKNDELLILGSGSNILFTKDFEGTILRSEIKFINELETDNDFVTLEIGSGVVWDELVDYCVNNGYAGIENLTHIPGTVGAAPIQNIGAYGVEFESVFVKLEGFDLETGVKKTYLKNECEFDYRDSVFKKKYKNKFLVTKVYLNLRVNAELNISYRAIKDYLNENNINDLDIKKVSEIITKIRNSKLPVPEKIGNAGSFFKNPIVDKKTFIKIKNENKDLVFFRLENDNYKIPAGWLIEKCGFKGKRFGNVGVHDKQALVLVNYGNGKGSDLLELSEKIKRDIKYKFNINLETEVNIV